MMLRKSPLSLFPPSSKIDCSQKRGFVWKSKTKKIEWALETFRYRHGSMKLMRLSFLRSVSCLETANSYFMADNFYFNWYRKTRKIVMIFYGLSYSEKLICSVEIRLSSRPLDQKPSRFFNTLQLVIEFLRLSACQKSFFFFSQQM